MESSEFDLKELAGILQRQIRLIGVTFLIVLLPAISYLVVATPIYRASALLSIDAGGSNLLDANAPENTQSAVLNSRVDGEVEVLRADSTVMAVVEQAQLITDPEFGPSLSLKKKFHWPWGWMDWAARFAKCWEFASPMCRKATIWWPVR